jgi:hypothetical protein
MVLKTYLFDLWTLLASQFYKIFFLFGRRARFFHALRLIRIAEPFLRRLPRYRTPAHGLGSDREFLTSALLNTLSDHDVEFDADILVTGDELPADEGAILISGHFYLNFVFFRRLYDIGRQTTIFLVTPPKEWRVMGTKVPLEVLRPRAASLLQVKRRISEGRLVALAIDNFEQLPNYKKLNVPGRDVFVSDSIIKFAEKLNIPLFFFDTFFDKDNRIVVNVRKAEAKQSALVLDEFADFIAAARKKRFDK